MCFLDKNEELFYDGKKRIEDSTLLGGVMYKQDILTDYFEEIRQKVHFKKWFFEHYHDNRNVSAEEILLYEQIIRIS